jgi:26S proteasome regulatory subunit N7
MDFAFTGSMKKRAGPTKKWTSKQIKDEVAKFDTAIETAREREGDLEVRDAVLEKAQFLKDEAQDYPAAEIVFREAYKLSGGPSRKIEILFEILLMNIEKFDIEAVKKDIAACLLHVEEGADWDKKNKLKVFEGVYCMIIRDFKKASDLFLSCVASFTCVELMEYKQFVFYAVVMAMVSQDRKTLKA